MIHRLFPFLLLPLLGIGCAGKPMTTPAPVTEQSASSGKDLLAQARVLRYSGRYAESLQRLETALIRQPESTDLQDEWIQTERAWRRLETELGDQLLAIEAKTRLELRPRLEKLVRADPDNPPLRDKLDQLRDTLHEDPAALSACGQRQAKIDTKLARRCLSLALQHRDDLKDRQQLAALQPKRKTKNHPAVPHQDLKTAKAETAREAGLAEPEQYPELLKARELYDEGKYFGSVRLLEKLQNQGNAPEESKQLLQQSQSALEQETLRLLAEGDTHYRDGRVRQALIRWQAALAINPYSQKAREKTERGLKVLGNLQALQEKPK